MRLKGKNIKNIKKDKKAVMEKTLKHMSDNRKKDTKKLRHLIEEKYSWAKEEIKRGELQIKAINIQLAKLQGIVLFSENLLDIGKK